MNNANVFKIVVIVFFMLMASLFYWSLMALWNAHAQNLFAVILPYLMRYWIQTVGWVIAMVVLAKLLWDK